MSLEAAIQENTSVLKQLITVLQSGAAISPTAEPEKQKPTRASKKADEPKGDAGNAAAGPAEQPAATQQTSAPSDPSAQAQSATASESKPSTTTSTTEPSFDDVTKKIIELNKSQKPGHGRDGVLSVLTKFLGTSEGKKVPDLKAVGKNAEIAAFVDSLLKAGGDSDESDLGI